MREVFNALRWMMRSGSPWRYLPGDFPRWDVVYQQTQRWLAAGCYEAMAHDLRLALRVLNQREPAPSAAIYDSRTLSSTPGSGARAGSMSSGIAPTRWKQINLSVEAMEMEIIALLEKNPEWLTGL